MERALLRVKKKLDILGLQSGTRLMWNSIYIYKVKPGKKSNQRCRERLGGAKQMLTSCQEASYVENEAMS